MSTAFLPNPPSMQQEVNACTADDQDDVQCDSLRYDTPQMPDLSQALIEIDEEMGEDDIEGLKFLCRDHIPVSKLDKAETALEIFDTMKKHVLIADNNFDFLLECLARIHRVDLTRKLGVQPEAVRNHVHEFKKIFPFRTLLMDLIEDLDNQEVEKVRFFLRGKIRKKALHDNRSFPRLLIFMEQEGLLAHNNLELLTKVMESIRRGDLVDKIREYQGLRPLQRHDPGIHRNANIVLPSQQVRHIGSGHGLQERPLPQESSQQRRGLVQSGSAGNIVGQDRNLPGNFGGQDQNLPGNLGGQDQNLPRNFGGQDQNLPGNFGQDQNLPGQNQNSQIERSVSAGTLSVSSEENMEIPNTRVIPEPLFLQIADDLKHQVDNLGFELGFSNDQLDLYEDQIPDVKQRTLKMLQDWQNSVVDKGKIASGLHYVLGKLDLKSTASILKQWMDSFSTSQAQGRQSLSDFEPTGPPEETENVCVSYRNAQPAAPVDQFVQQNSDNVQVVTDLQQLNITREQLADQRCVKYVNGMAVYKEGNQVVVNTGISQPLPPFVQNQVVPNVPVVPGQVAPNVPVIPGQMAPNVPVGPGQVAPNVPVVPGQVAPNVPFVPGQVVPNVPVIPGQVMQGMPVDQGQVRQTGPLGGSQLPCYRMDRKPRGWCVIINNEKFHVDQSNRGGQAKEMPPRNGTERDAATLQELFTKLGFIVRRHDNLSDSQMMNVLIDASHNVDHTNFDCFICCILTHGVLGYLYGSNGALVSIKDLTATFQTNRCTTLAGKPKLFFLQACQGRDKMEGGEIERDGPQPVPSNDLAVDNRVKEMIPNEADFLLGYATVPGYVSFRSRNHGSWYIRKLCELLEKYANSYDLMTILVEVNNQVASANANMDEKLYKQIPAPLVTLRKRLYFK